MYGRVSSNPEKYVLFSAKEFRPKRSLPGLHGILQAGNRLLQRTRVQIGEESNRVHAIRIKCQRLLRELPRLLFGSRVHCFERELLRLLA